MPRTRSASLKSIKNNNEKVIDVQKHVEDTVIECPCSNLKSIVKRLQKVSDKLVEESESLSESNDIFAKYISSVLKGLLPNESLKLKQQLLQVIHESLLSNHKRGRAALNESLTLNEVGQLDETHCNDGTGISLSTFPGMKNGGKKRKRFELEDSHDFIAEANEDQPNERDEANGNTKCLPHSSRPDCSETISKLKNQKRICSNKEFLKLAIEVFDANANKTNNSDERENIEEGSILKVPQSNPMQPLPVNAFYPQNKDLVEKVADTAESKSNVGKGEKVVDDSNLKELHSVSTEEIVNETPSSEDTGTNIDMLHGVFDAGESTSQLSFSTDSDNDENDSITEYNKYLKRSPYYKYAVNPGGLDFPVPVRRRRWTEEEKEVVYKHFGKYLLRFKHPGRSAIQKVYAKEPLLQTRSLDQVCSFINNITNGHVVLSPYVVGRVCELNS